MEASIKHNYMLAGALSVFAVSLVALSSFHVINLSDLVTATTTLVAAFMGAYLAFFLNRVRESDALLRSNKAAIDRGLFVLARQSNAIESFRGTVSAYKEDLDRAFSMPAFKPPTYEGLTQDFDSLMFLLGSSDPELVLMLSIEQERFEQTIESIRIRNEFYINEIQPALIGRGLTGVLLCPSDIEAALDERLYKGAIQGAETVFEHLDTVGDSLICAYSRLLQIARAKFPGEKFIVWDIGRKTSV